MHHTREHEEETEQAPHRGDSISERLPERVALARKVRFDTFLTSAAAVVVGAAVVAVYVLALSPGDLPSDFHVVEAIGLLAAYLAIAIPIGDVLSARPARHAQARLERGLPVSPEQRAAVVGIPWRAAMTTFWGWTIAAAVFAVYYSLRYDDPASQVARFALTIVLGGLTTSALVFLLNEDRCGRSTRSPSRASRRPKPRAWVSAGAWSSHGFSGQASPCWASRCPSSAAIATTTRRSFAAS